MAKKKTSSKGAGSGARAGNSVDTDILRLEQILDLVDKHGLSEFEWERGNERLRFRSKDAGAMAYSGHAPAMVAPHSHVGHAYSPQLQHVAAAPAPAPQHTVAKESSAPAAASAGKSSNLKTINSPFVGTFYRAASPESEPYVREGQVIKRGDVLCIIEAMKLMNEIEAEVSGKIVNILVENGQPVEFGEPLFELEP